MRRRNDSRINPAENELGIGIVIADVVVHHIRATETFARAFCIFIIIVVVKAEQVSRLVNVGLRHDFEPFIRSVSFLSEIRIVAVAGVLVHKVEARKEIISHFQAVVFLRFGGIRGDVRPINRVRICLAIISDWSGIDEIHRIDDAVIVRVVLCQIERLLIIGKRKFEQENIARLGDCFAIHGDVSRIVFIIFVVFIGDKRLLHVKSHVEFAIRRFFVVGIYAFPTSIRVCAVERFAKPVHLLIADRFVRKLHRDDQKVVCAG